MTKPSSKVTITNTNDFRLYIRSVLKFTYPDSSNEKLKALENFAVECFSSGYNMLGGKLVLELPN